MNRLFALVFGSLAVLIFLAIFIYAPAELRAERACLSHGYPSTKVTVTLDVYCVKRVDMSDVVVSLDSLRRTR